MNESAATIAGLRTIVVAPEEPSRLSVIVLHGFAMTPEMLAPFAHSLSLPATFYLPEAPLPAKPDGRAWWPIDTAARDEEMRTSGPRDLATRHPAGVAEARALLLALLDDVRQRDPAVPVVLVGFSQGGMLATDTVLREQPRIAALALLSSTRIAFDEWQPLVPRLRGLPVLVSHGEKDPDLSFAAGEGLRDMALAGGAAVTWVPFEQGHEIPLVVWRAVRRFLKAEIRD